MDTFPFSPLLFFLFSKWVIVKQFMYSLSACVFIGASELGLNPSPEVVFETWKEAPNSSGPHLSLSSPLTLSFILSAVPSHSQS